MSFGSFLIILSLLVSLVSLVFLVRSARGSSMALVTVQRLFYLSGIFITFAVILLFAAFLNHSFQYTYVYNYSSLDLPLLYQVAGFWAGQEGTFLLWVFLLFIFGVFIIKEKHESQTVLLSILTITQIFILIIISMPEYSPFRYVWSSFPEHFKAGTMPADGAGLNPLLQNPWMIIHPPVLFIGYASATMPFAYAVFALIKNDYTVCLAKAYRWVLFCSLSLGIGIFLGGYWAYTVLDWGGYWGWDAVENSSLIPWIVIIALLHGLHVQKRKGALVKTNIILSILSLVLVFCSTFLTRSGILADFSVHSFGDLGLSGPLFLFMLFFLALGLILFFIRFKVIPANSLGDKILTAENLLALGIISLCLYSFFILIGTIMPVISKYLMENPTTVNVRFYNNLSIPFGLIMLLLIVLSTLYIMSKKLSPKEIGALSAVSITGGILFNIFSTDYILAYLFTMVSIFLIIQQCMDIFKIKTRLIVSSRISHIGLAFLVIGIISSNIHSTSIKKNMELGKEENINGTAITFNGKTDAEKSGIKYILKQGTSVYNIETPYYFDKRINSLFREPYIHYGFFYDLYITTAEYFSGRERASQHMLGKEIVKIIDGMEYEFLGFDTKNFNMMSGNGTLKARIKINKKGGSYNISPGIEIKNGSIVNNIKDKVPGSEREVSLLKLDVRTQEIHIFVEPAKGEEMPPDSVIVDISHKRLIWIVWLGTVLIAVGGVLAIRRTA